MFCKYILAKKAEKEKEEWPYGLEDIPAFWELFGDS